MSKKYPSGMKQDKQGQQTILNFFAKTQHQQSKLFTHVPSKPKLLKSGSSLSRENAPRRSKLSVTAHNKGKGKSSLGLLRKHEKTSSSEKTKNFLTTPGRKDTTMLSPTTVIPETPESLMSKSSEVQEMSHPSSQQSPVCIADTPPAVIIETKLQVTQATGDKKKMVLRQIPEPNPLPAKRSKLSRKFNRQMKTSKLFTNESTADENNGDFVIKPTVTFGKKRGSSKKAVANSKRSPARGNSPYSKRTHTFEGNQSMKTRVRKHLFNSSGKDTTVYENLDVMNVMIIKGEEVETSVLIEDELLPSRKAPSSYMASLPHELANGKEESDIVCKAEGQNVREENEENCVSEKDQADVKSEMFTDHRILKTENIPCNSDRIVPEDKIHCEMPKINKETGPNMLDKSVEWDELNESLLASLDEDSLEDDFQSDTMSSSKGHSMVEETLAPTFAKLSPFKKPQDGPTPLPPNLNRFMVKAVQTKSNGEKMLQLKNLASLDNQLCVVQGVWSEIPYREGDLLAIHGQWTNGECTISQSEGFVVYDPDLLLTGTAVANSIRCMRRSVLDGYFKGIDKGNKAMVLGTLVHEVFDKSLRRRKFDEVSLKKFAAESVRSPSFRNKLYSMQMKESVILQDIEEYYKPLQLWAKKYLQPSPSPHAVVDIKWPDTKISEKFQVSLPKVQDIEDNFWSPRWGLKGKVDVTAQVKIHKKDRPMRNKSYTLPLELKTGRQTNSIEHHGQLVLYNLMMADLDPQVPPIGLLLYLKTGAMMSVTASHMDKRELLHLRNQLAYYMSKTAVQSQTADGEVSFRPQEMPSPIQDDFTCKKCAHLTSCAMFSRLNPAPLSQMAQEMFDAQIGHLSNSHLQYFVHWYTLCLLERMETKRKNTVEDVWNKPFHEREKKGSCCGDLIVKESKTKNMVDFEITFCKKDRSSSIKFHPGDWLIVSQENQKIAKLIGTAKFVSENTITISTDSSLPTYVQSPVVYCLDKNDSYDSLASSFVNLAYLMSQTAHMSKLRDLIIDLSAPSFSSPSTPLGLSYEAEKILQSLNEDQRGSIDKVLHSKDYGLILGMPGTGKTTTVTSLVRILVLQGKSVLLTSYTHSAVDNILLKLRKHRVSFLRLGSSYRIHQHLQQFSEETALKGLGVDEMSNIIDTMPVIAATSLGVKSALLTHKHFDYCIIDEASQISQPVCLAPLFKSSKFVLVGDHKQLPPLVQSTQARTSGMDESLFQRLGTSHPEAVSELRLQYRMHPLIMDLSNAFMYEGALQCGNLSEQSNFLSLPYLDESVSLSSWCQKAVSPEIIVQLFSTEKFSCDSYESGLNKAEASLVKETIESLIQFGCDPGDIGVITPFRKQCHLLQTMMAVLSKDIEVNTIDKYQGRDKSVIVLSFTIYKQEGASILDDARRLNVALTRAKKKLVMFGNGAVLRQSVTLSRLLGVLEERQWITVLPENNKL